MAGEQAPAPVSEAKKKRRVKKKVPPPEQKAGVVASVKDTTKPAAMPEPPARRPKMTMKDRQYVDYVRELTMKNVWYYRDRLSVPRGPCNVAVLRECWVHGVIDEHTLVWGQGLGDWLPVRNIRTLVPQIRTFEVRVATWIKRTFALKPALAQARKDRAEFRKGPLSSQADDMY
ncbi:hypothetical protein WJX81_000283 [Elliptochloris bilobata]|uniref:GYF domain-containing protein n=1 Tax=Elliptochloris bilobata TaxID=381761 RepID=A0AAW1RMB7_9CHLO